MSFSDQPAGIKNNWAKLDLDDSKWQTQKLPETATDAAALLSWHRLAFSLPATKPGVWVPWLIRLHANGNGMISLNGHALGRYWQKGGQRDFFLPECWLNFGQDLKNVISLEMCPIDSPIAIQSAVVMPYTAYAEQR